MTLRARIAAVASVAVALAVIGAAVGLYVAVRSELRGEVDKGLRQRAGAFLPNAPLPPAGPGQGVPLFGAPPGRPAPGGFPSRVQPSPLTGAGYVQFITPQGGVQVPAGQGSRSAIPPTRSELAIARSGRGQLFADTTYKRRQLRVLTIGAGPAGAIFVARDLGEVNRELNHIALILALIAAAGVALAAVLGTLVARAALTPIAAFTRRAETLSGKLDLSERLQVRGRDEIARLARSFNATLDALERSVQAQRHLIADASHELRTPIASLRANIQILQDADRLPTGERDALRQDIIDELDELTALVGDVVELARGSGDGRQFDELRLDEIVATTVERTRRRCDLRFDVQLEPTVVLGAADQVARAVSNLLDNARKWSPPGGVVEVALRNGVLTVRDRGAGFDEADLPHVFDRFYRAEQARGLPGSGLGLAIVRQAAEACGGSVHADNAPGGGALLQVSFGTPVEFSPDGRDG